MHSRLKKSMGFSVVGTNSIDVITIWKFLHAASISLHSLLMVGDGDSPLAKAPIDMVLSVLSRNLSGACFVAPAAVAIIFPWDIIATRTLRIS